MRFRSQLTQTQELQDCARTNAAPTNAKTSERKKPATTSSSQLRPYSPHNTPHTPHTHRPTTHKTSDNDNASICCPLGVPVIFAFLKSPTLSPRLHRLRETALLNTLTPLELKIVDGLMHERRYLADEIIFEEGEEGQALYLVMSGRVIISREFGAGREIVAELSAGSF